MQGVVATQWVTQEYETVLIAGNPKLGKTTLATSAPGPIALIACDLGKLSIYPGTKREELLVLPYQDLTREMGDLGTSNPKVDVFRRLTRDLNEIYKAIRDEQPLKVEGQADFPTPRTLVLDGFSRLNDMLVDGKLAMQNKAYVEDLDKAMRFSFWGKRAQDIYTIIQQFASLKKCHVVITSWMQAETKTGEDGKSYETGVWWPSVGGKNNMRTAGVVSNAVVVEGRGGKFYARTKPDGKYPWLGLRDNFTTPAEVDVTYVPGGPSPWVKLFGKGAGA